MYSRSLKPLKTNIFFLFGARGTGKSTWVKSALPEKRTLYLDLLDDETFDQVLRSTSHLEAACEKSRYDWIVFDEVQRVPKVLNFVHRMIEKYRQKFVLTGSSSRKLKHGGANLLAGRAFVNQLFPLTVEELKKDFNLQEALEWGTLPKIFDLKTPQEKRAYLRAYCLTYIKEEIQMEQAVRKLEPFREFLAVSAQMSGKIINHSAIAREVGTYASTIQSYFQVLEDSYIGFYLPVFHRSVRKSQIESPKFYLFDNGVKRSLDTSISGSVPESTGAYGELFESFFIQEVFRLNHYYEKDFRLSFYATKHGAEVDLVLSRGKQVVLVEIKSTKRVDPIEVRRLAKVKDDFGGNARAYYVSRDNEEFEDQGVRRINWSRFLAEFPSL